MSDWATAHQQCIGSIPRRRRYGRVSAYAPQDERRFQDGVGPKSAIRLGRFNRRHIVVSHRKRASTSRFQHFPCAPALVLDRRMDRPSNRFVTETSSTKNTTSKSDCAVGKGYVRVPPRGEHPRALELRSQRQRNLLSVGSPDPLVCTRSCMRYMGDKSGSNPPTQDYIDPFVR